MPAERSLSRKASSVGLVPRMQAAVTAATRDAFLVLGMRSSEASSIVAAKRSKCPAANKNNGPAHQSEDRQAASGLGRIPDGARLWPCDAAVGDSSKETRPSAWRRPTALGWTDILRSLGHRPGRQCFRYEAVPRRHNLLTRPDPQICHIDTNSSGTDINLAPLDRGRLLAWYVVGKSDKIVGNQR